MSFQADVLALTAKIPRGKITTYKHLAAMLGNKNASRACGNALNKNPDLIVVPCHRVVRSDGSIGGYAGGTNKKRALLESEGVHIINGKVSNFEQKLWKQ